MGDGAGRMSASITVSHNFETAHRLPHLLGKCQSLHGHSWWVEVTVAGETDDDGVLVEFGVFKAALRSWIDKYLDHGVMLGADDPLVRVLDAQYATKLYVFAQGWPTVESVAELLAYVAAQLVPDGAVVSHVEVQETRTNRAGWTR